MDQLFQIVGAALILGAFLLNQARKLGTESYPYLFMNIVGSAILAIDAFREAQWGFLLLEAVWCGASTSSAMRRLASRSAVR